MSKWDCEPVTITRAELEEYARKAKGKSFFAMARDHVRKAVLRNLPYMRRATWTLINGGKP